MIGKFIRDWRLWASLLAIVLASLFVWHLVQRGRFDHVELARSAVVEKGFKKEDLFVSSYVMNSSLFVGEEATVVFQIGTEKNAKRVTVRMRRPVFGPAIVENIE